MQAWTETLLSQYATAPTLTSIIGALNAAIDPAADLNSLYSNIWNINTAAGAGLDILGRIVGLQNGRQIMVPVPTAFFGFGEALTTSGGFILGSSVLGTGVLGTASAINITVGPQPFGQAPFALGVTSPQTYALSDDAFRRLILVKAASNITNCTAPSLNALLSLLYSPRGSVYVQDLGGMSMNVVFNFTLTPADLGILGSGVIPHPAGVQVSVVQGALTTLFGFREGNGQPFNTSPFYAPTPGI